MLDIAGEHADGAEDPRQRRHDHAPDAEFAREVGGVHAAIAAEGHQRQIARIAAALDRDGADSARHGGIGDGANAVRCLLGR